MYPNSISNAKTATDQPVLVEGCKRIAQHTNNCHEAASRIENVLDRLLNPTPHPAETNAPAPQPATIEAMMSVAGSNIEGLSMRLHDLAARLERAA